MRVLLAISAGILTIGSLRFHALFGSSVLPHMSSGEKPPASPMAIPTSIGHQPSDRFRKPDSEAEYWNWPGCQIASVSAAEPAIDRPTAALRLLSTPLVARKAGSSWVRKVSHL